MFGWHLFLLISARLSDPAVDVKHNSDTQDPKARTARRPPGRSLPIPRLRRGGVLAPNSAPFSSRRRFKLMTACNQTIAGTEREAFAFVMQCTI